MWSQEKSKIANMVLVFLLRAVFESELHKASKVNREDEVPFPENPLILDFPLVSTQQPNCEVILSLQQADSCSA